MSAKDTKNAKLWTVAWIPFILSAICFLSGFLVVLAPLPLLLLKEWRGNRWWLLATVTNLIGAAVLGRLSGGPQGFWLGAIWLILVWPISFLVPLCLKRTRNFLGSFGVGLSLHMTALAFLLVVAILGKAAFDLRKDEKAGMATNGITIGALVQRSEFNLKEGSKKWVAELTVALDEPTKQKIAGTEDPSEFERAFRRSLPFGLVLFIGILHFLSTVILLRINPFRLGERVGIAPDFFQRIRVPEWFIWPALGFGFFWVAEGWWIHPPVWAEILVSDGVKVCSTVYLLQGLSILHFVMMKMRSQTPLGSFFQLFVQIVLLVFASMVLIILGFIDLWFDFRKKLGQS